MTELTARELLTHLYHTGVDAVDGRKLVYQWCRVSSRSFKYCIAIGKAAPAMLQGALDSVPAINKALLISNNLPARKIAKDKRVVFLKSAHPVPDESSLDAGRALLQFLKTIPEDEPVLFLISGGTSSLVEVLVDGVTLEQLQSINQYLLASGKDISQINAWRKQCSRIKGGGLLDYVQAGQCVQLLLSDVPGDDVAVIGSGLLVTSDASVDDDAWLQQQFGENTMDSSGHDAIETHLVGTHPIATQAIYKEALANGLECTLHDEFLSGDAADTGRKIAQWLCSAAAGVHIWAAETTVSLPETPGLGGRNQTFALAAAEVIEGQEDLAILAAGSDGIDGNTPCAGAVVYGATMADVRQYGFNVRDELEKANAGVVLMASGDLFKPGPTNTNIMDLVIAYKR